MALRKMLVDAKVTEQKKLVDDIYLMKLDAPDIAKTAKPGNFVQVKATRGNTLLRRPLGIAEVNENSVSLIYRKIGKGTAELSTMQPNEIVSLMGPIGNTFNLNLKKPLLVGGGMGLSPLLFYAEYMKNASVLMGAKTCAELFWEKLFAPFASEIFIATEDGSKGKKGFNVALLPEILRKGDFDGVIVCGPDPMMKKSVEIAKDADIPVEVSLERRMGCGLGACLSCAIDTKSGRKKVCKDGPIFSGEEVFYQ